jgi:hypothetical protein
LNADGQVHALTGPINGEIDQKAGNNNNNNNNTPRATPELSSIVLGGAGLLAFGG